MFTQILRGSPSVLCFIQYFKLDIFLFFELLFDSVNADTVQLNLFSLYILTVQLVSVNIFIFSNIGLFCNRKCNLCLLRFFSVQPIHQLTM
jgi:hypothetical protein